MKNFIKEAHKWYSIKSIAYLIAFMFIIQLPNTIEILTKSYETTYSYWLSIFSIIWGLPGIIYSYKHLTNTKKTAN